MLTGSLAPALAIVVFVQASAAVAQAPRGQGAKIAAPDSARLVRAARAAQSEFEAFRRARVPWREGAHGPCDVTIGRYCYWRGDEEDDSRLPVEPAPIRERRERLVHLLDSAARILPGDPWLAGQRARYVVETGDTTRARAAMADCRGLASWCAALTGYVLHVTGDYAGANSAYERALASMDTDERCRWMDIASLLDDDLGKRYDSLDCPSRERMARRLFALGAPFYVVAATDLFTEHLSRYTRARMAEDAATTYGDRWADDARELVLRYGWPAWYSRSEATNGRPSITGHDAGRPYYLLPSLRALDHPGTASLDDWRLDDARAPMGYASATARSIHALPQQIARFRHGESTFVIAAWDASRDTSIGRDADAALALTDDAAVRTIVRIPGGSGRAGSAAATIVADSGIVSIEVLDREARHAARVRLGFAPPPAGRARLSDLLLYRPWTTDVPRSADASLAEHAVRGDAVARRDTVAVYWELYGLSGASEPVRYTLSVEQVGVSWARRAVERLRLADRTSGVRIEWTEVPILDGDRAGRGVRVDVSRLRPGRYRMELTATARGDAKAASIRELVVR